MIFDQSYYENIWGTVHRHDYTDSLANFLIDKYGKGRILDIGTGCGHLVKTLREKGCDAWGLEISEYAINNSCCPDYVRRGDIRDIPFASNRFDVVHSQGVWGYFIEIEQAWAECNRVGKIQHHNIDSNDHIPEHQYLVIESREWWQNKLYPKILVACPNHICKEYSFQRWIDNVKSFTYPNIEIFVVDNSPNAELKNKYGDQINIYWDEQISEDQVHSLLRINNSMEVIRDKFVNGNYSRWFNVESDVVPPADAYEQMIKHGLDSDWISHAYPTRSLDGDGEDVQQGIGCSIFSKRLMESVNYKLAGDDNPDGWLWQKVRPTRKFTTMELWGYFKVKHYGKV